MCIVLLHFAKPNNIQVVCTSPIRVQMICEIKYFQCENVVGVIQTKEGPVWQRPPFKPFKNMIFPMEKPGEILKDTNFYPEARKFREGLEV